MDEKNSNRLLRRVDWRFLLENPTPEKSICFGDGILRQAVERISLMPIDPRNSEREQCDLAVVRNPSEAVLQSAFDALCPGGEIYTEWTLPRVGGAKGVCHRLEQMGFTNVTCYWAWPPPMFASSLYWLPLDSTRILRYFFGNRPLSSSVAVQMGRFLLQKIITLGLHTRLLMPISAIARKPAFDNQGALRTRINTEIIKHWQSKSLGMAPSQLRGMLWTPGYRSINKVIAFIFSENNDKPIQVVKTVRSQDSGQALASEANNLQRLSSAKKSAADSIPSVLFSFDWKGVPVVGESFVPGSPIYSLLNRDNYREMAIKMTDWSIALAGESIPSPRSEWWDRLVQPVLQEFLQSFGAVFTSQELCVVHDVLNQLTDLPIVFEQRDCSPWNILMDDQGDIKVLDWESSEPHGLPTIDLIYFLTYLSFFVEGVMESREYAKVYSNVFDTQSPTGRINNECLEKYCMELNLNPSAVRPLRLLTWLIHSHSEYKRLVEDSGSMPSPSALRIGLFATLIREEIQLYSKVDC